MAKTGINFQRCNVGSVEAHNERTQEYLDGVKKSGRKIYFFQDLTHLNKSIVNPEYENLSCAEIFEKQKDIYMKNVGQKPNLEDRVITNQKTGKQRTVSGWSPLREGVAPIKEDTKLEDFAPFIAWCNDNGLNVVRIDLHFDEGYENTMGERTFNRHAHIVVDWMDWSTGKTAKLDAKKMSEAQDVIAVSLGMERGEKKLETGAVHLNPTEYREKAAGEHLIRLEAENQRLTDENEKLKKDNDTLRQANTGISAKYIDAWKYKGRAKKAESDLDAERKAHNEELSKRDAIIAELEKKAEKAEFAISHYRTEASKLQKENQRLSVVANRWERMYNDLFRKEEPKKGISR